VHGVSAPPQCHIPARQGSFGAWMRNVKGDRRWDRLISRHASLLFLTRLR
jgi:hypothetical protein